MNLEWNVYREDINSREIKPFNIFRHVQFKREIEALMELECSREEFAELVRKVLQYYFWSKCEYEIVLSAWPPRDDISKKVDIYSQVLLNWQLFIDYLTGFRVQKDSKDHIICDCFNLIESIQFAGGLSEQDEKDFINVEKRYMKLWKGKNVNASL